MTQYGQENLVEITLQETLEGFSIVEDVNDNSFVVTGLNNLSTGGLNFDLYILKVDYHGNTSTSTFEILPNPDEETRKNKST